MNKICSICKESKDLNNLYKGGKDGQKNIQ